jgi:hypothetical protein
VRAVAIPPPFTTLAMLSFPTVPANSRAALLRSVVGAKISSSRSIPLRALVTRTPAILPIFTAVETIFLSVSTIFSMISNIFSTIMSVLASVVKVFPPIPFVFHTIPQPAVALGIAKILASISVILSTISPIFSSITAIFPVVPSILPPVAFILCPISEVFFPIPHGLWRPIPSRSILISKPRVSLGVSLGPVGMVVEESLVLVRVSPTEFIEFTLSILLLPSTNPSIFLRIGFLELFETLPHFSRLLLHRLTELLRILLPKLLHLLAPLGLQALFHLLKFLRIFLA